MADKNTITLDITLDENKYPAAIHWTSDDNPLGKEPTECKAMLLSLFDADYKDTYRIDLWTKEMQVPEMNMFMFYTLRGMADTYFNATKNAELASAIRQLADYIAEKTSTEGQ